MGLTDFKFGYGGAVQGFQVGGGTEAPAHFVGDGTHVGSQGYAGAEVGAVALDSSDYEFLDLDLHRLQDYRLLFSRQPVGGDAEDFLARDRRRASCVNLKKWH